METIKIKNNINASVDTDYKNVHLYLDLESLELSVSQLYDAGTPGRVWDGKALLLGPNLRGVNGDSVRDVAEKYLDTIAAIAKAKLAKDSDAVTSLDQDLIHKIQGEIHDPFGGLLYVEAEEG